MLPAILPRAGLALERGAILRWRSGADPEAPERWPASAAGAWCRSRPPSIVVPSQPQASDFGPHVRRLRPLADDPGDERDEQDRDAAADRERAAAAQGRDGREHGQQNAQRYEYSDQTIR